MADALLMALAGAWDAIRARHQEVPPVVLVVGWNSRPTAKRRTFAHFAPTGWGPPAPSDSGRLSAGLNAIDDAIRRGDHDALRSALAASAQATLLAAAQVSREAELTLSEVLVTQEGLARGPAEVLETLLHEAAHGSAYHRGISDTSRQGRYHNHRFKTVAEEFGLDLCRDPVFGWSRSSLSAETASSYSETLACLTVALTQSDAASLPVGVGSGGTARNTATLVCRCGHRIRSRHNSFAARPVICGVCWSR